MAAKQWFTTEEVMEVTGLNYFQVYRRITSGKIRATRAGAREPYLVHAADLRVFLAEQKLDSERRRLAEERKNVKRWRREDGWFNVEEAAEEAGLYPLTVRNAITGKYPNAPRLKFYRESPKGNIHIHVDDLKNWLERREAWQRQKQIDSEVWQNKKAEIQERERASHHIGVKTLVPADRWEKAKAK